MRFLPLLLLIILNACGDQRNGPSSADLLTAFNNCVKDNGGPTPPRQGINLSIKGSPSIEDKCWAEVNNE